jgi:glycosyltransferase involved in cell wall biosynthesis
MRFDDGQLGPLRVLYLGRTHLPSSRFGPSSIVWEYARRAANRGWTTTLISADPAVTDWADVHESREPDQWFTRFAVPRSEPDRGPLLGPSSEPERRDPATRFFVESLRRIAPDLVHVVDNVDLPIDWPELAAQAGVPVVRTVTSTEDLCALPRPVSPLSGPRGFCAAPLTAANCASCLAASEPELARPAPRTQPVETPVRLLERLEVKRARAARQFGSVFDRIVFSTPAWRRYFEETLPLDPERVRVIEMGMDLALWRNRPARTPKRTGEAVELVLVGSLHPSKGQLDALAAFSRPELVDRGDYRLRVIGDGDQEMLVPLVQANPNVEVLGPYEQGDLPALLSSADVGLSTSLFETFDRVTREYLLAGLPVVANPNLGIEGLVVHDENGLLYDRATPDGLARAVCQTLDDRPLLERLTVGATITASKLAFQDAEMAELVSLYDEVVRAHAGALARVHRRVGA